MEFTNQNYEFFGQIKDFTPDVALAPDFEKADRLIHHFMDQAEASGNHSLLGKTAAILNQIPGYLSGHDLKELNINLILKHLQFHISECTHSDMLMGETLRLFHAYFLCLQKFQMRDIHREESLERFWQRLNQAFEGRPL